MRSPGSPRLYRILLPARDLDSSRRFYERLLGTDGREVGGGRIYFDSGQVILGILDRSDDQIEELAGRNEAIYFATDQLEEIHRRARELGCLSTELLHGDPASPMGEMVERPWGERSFYVSDPSGNALCFVDSTTLFTGTAAQVERLRRTT